MAHVVLRRLCGAKQHGSTPTAAHREVILLVVFKFADGSVGGAAACSGSGFERQIRHSADSAS
jgi:hypothetical protein